MHDIYHNRMTLTPLKLNYVIYVMGYVAHYNNELTKIDSIPVLIDMLIQADLFEERIFPYDSYEYLAKNIIKQVNKEIKKNQKWEKYLNED